MKPEIFDTKFKDGSHFRASDSFVRKFLCGVMSCSLRQGTQAAQKLPNDWEDKCEHSFLRKVYVIKEHDIPIELYINSDQTQVVYAPGNRMMWSPIGAKQVAIVGVDEKQAFTLMVSIATDGTLLPFQAIYMGSTKVSLPNPAAKNYSGLLKAGTKLKASGTKTYC